MVILDTSSRGAPPDRAIYHYAHILVSKLMFSLFARGQKIVIVQMYMYVIIMLNYRKYLF